MINLQDRTFLAEIVDHCKDTQATAVVQAVRHKVHRPVLIDPVGCSQHDPKVTAPFFAPLKPQRKPFFAVQTFGAFVIYQKSLAS
jgi:hypothetical protein